MQSRPTAPTWSERTKGQVDRTYWSRLVSAAADYQLFSKLGGPHFRTLCSPVELGEMAVLDVDLFGDHRTSLNE